MESCTCHRCGGGTPPPPPCDGWLGLSAFALTKRTCSKPHHIGSETTNKICVQWESFLKIGLDINGFWKAMTILSRFIGWNEKIRKTAGLVLCNDHCSAHSGLSGGKTDGRTCCMGFSSSLCASWSKSCRNLQDSVTSVTILDTVLIKSLRKKPKLQVLSWTPVNNLLRFLHWYLVIYARNTCRNICQMGETNLDIWHGYRVVINVTEIDTWCPYSTVEY